MRRIDYIIWYVADLERSIAFYRDMIGVPFKLLGEGYAEFATENTKFALFERSGLPDLIGGGAGAAPCGEVGFRVEDVDAQARRLRDAGADIRTGPVDRPWGERTLHVADPDGNIIEFAQKL